MNKIKLTPNDFIFIDSKTRGCKTLQKKLDKMGIKWSNEVGLENKYTYFVCTRYEGMNYGYHNVYENKFESRRITEEGFVNWKSFHNVNIYSLPQFDRAISEFDELDEADKILDLLKSGNDTNATLAIQLINNYEIDERWIPWLLMNSSNKDIRKYLRVNNIQYSTQTFEGNKWDVLYHLKSIINHFQVPKEQRLDFIKEFINEF